MQISISYCLVVLLSFICSNNGHPKITTTTFEGIPDNWSTNTDADPFAKVGDKYYYVENKILTNWFDAAQICRTKNAHLATIESNSEGEELFKYLRSKDWKTWYWLSANDLSVEGEFVWAATGKRMTYNKWAKNQPDNAGENEHCVHLEPVDDTFLLNDRTCKDKAYFICQANQPKTIAFTVW